VSGGEGRVCGIVAGGDGRHDVQLGLHRLDVLDDVQENGGLSREREKGTMACSSSSFVLILRRRRCSDLLCCSASRRLLPVVEATHGTASLEVTPSSHPTPSSLTRPPSARSAPSASGGTRGVPRTLVLVPVLLAVVVRAVGRARGWPAPALPPPRCLSLPPRKPCEHPRTA